MSQAGSLCASTMDSSSPVPPVCTKVFTPVLPSNSDTMGFINSNG